MKKSLEEQIESNIEAAINYRGWDAKEGTPDHILAEWVMEFEPHTSDGDQVSVGPSIREILARE